MVEREQASEERARTQATEVGLALLHRRQRLDRLRSSRSKSDVGLARPDVGGRNAGGDEFGRRQRN